MPKLILVLFIVICAVNVLSENIKAYGKFKLNIMDAHVCKGPKVKDCTNMTLKVIGDHSIQMSIEVLNDVVIKKSKVIIISNGKQLMRLQVNSPCEHLFLKQIFAKMFHTSNDCKVLKGVYKQMHNIQEITDGYFGGAFFYGNYTFKATFNADDCNFSCSVVSIFNEPLKE